MRQSERDQEAQQSVCLRSNPESYEREEVWRQTGIKSDLTCNLMSIWYWPWKMFRRSRQDEEEPLLNANEEANRRSIFDEYQNLPALQTATPFVEKAREWLHIDQSGIVSFLTVRTASLYIVCSSAHNSLRRSQALLQDPVFICLNSIALCRLTNMP